MRSASTQRAAINLEKAKDDLTETEQQLKFQIASSKSDYQFSIEDYQNKKENEITYEIMVDYGWNIDPMEGKEL